MTTPPAPLRILFVDDSQADVELELWSLRKAGFAVDPLRVETAERLVAALLDFDPQLVVSDFRLPVLDGRTTFRLVRCARPSIPFLFVSGSTDMAGAVEGVTFVSKDRLPDLPEAVRRALEKPRS